MTSNQYAVAPMPIAATHAETYSMADPSTWTLTRVEGGVPVLYGGFEAVVFNSAQLAEIESMGGLVFASSQEYFEWLNS